MGMLGMLNGCGSGGGGEQAGPVSISINDVQIEEGASGSLAEAIFTVSLSRAHSNTVSVNYLTEDGDANAGEDYLAQQGTISIAPGDTSQSISINVIGDLNGEEDETFNIRLNTPVNGELSKSTGTATILNDDPIQLKPTPIVESPEVAIFVDTVYTPIFRNNDCQSCHRLGGQGKGAFADDNINTAFSAFRTYFNPIDTKATRDQSYFVMTIEGGHNCWTGDCLADANQLRDQLDAWVEAMVAAGYIDIPQPEFPVVEEYLQQPLEETIVPRKAFDASRDLPDLFLPIYELTRTHCVTCHGSTPINANAPMFAQDNIESAYAVVSGNELIDLTYPQLSPTYLALTVQHNCWSDCQSDAAEMLQLIRTWADHSSVQSVPFPDSIATSSALSLNQAQVAGPELRYDNAVIAKYRFTEGADDDPTNDTVARDTSWQAPYADLQLNGNVQWMDNYGIHLDGGYAINTSAGKLHDLILQRGEFAIEMWLNPLNTTQTGTGEAGYESAVIVSYSWGISRNFTFGQDLTNFVYFDVADTPFTTPPDLQYAQTGLQHIVLTYSQSNDRRLYINGEPILCDHQIFMVDENYPSLCSNVTGETYSVNLALWNQSYRLLLGSDNPGTQWSGDIRFLAIHNRELTQKQILHNFDAGVGRRFHMLFNISNIPGVTGVGNQSYIWFQVAINDSGDYIFHSPKFVDLELQTAPPINFAIKGMQIGINGRLAGVTQPYADLGYNQPLVVNANPKTLSTDYIVVPAELGAEDQFFLTFDEIAGVVSQ
jgi:hypothetical protein